MNISGNLKEVWRDIMRRLTRNIGTSPAYNIDPKAKVEINRILICRPNHRLGNQLLVTPLLQEVIEIFPHAKIDLFVKGKVAPVLFKNYEQVTNIIQLPPRPFSNISKYLQGWIRIKKNNYDLVINTVNHSSSGRLAAQFTNAKYKCFGDVNEAIRLNHSDHEHVAKHPVYSFRDYLTILGFPKNENQVPPLNLKLSSLEIKAAKNILNDIVSDDKKTISIFTYATGAKCYSQVWWEEFYGRLKTEFPGYNIIEVLPAENVSQISFKAPTFYSRDVRQIASLIANTSVFIGADSGMMHLASASQAPVVGLFQVTDAKTFGPYGNRSVAIDTNTMTVDECISIVSQILNEDTLRQDGVTLKNQI